MAEDIVLHIPNLKLPQAHFVLQNPKLQHLHAKAQEDLIAGVTADDMSPYYRLLLEKTPSIPRDDTLLARMEASNSETLAELEETLASAEKTEDETEISDALCRRASYFTKIGDRDRALEAQKLALEKTSGLGSRIDIVLTLIRIGFFFSDEKVIEEWIAKAGELIEQGGDCSRRNRLKVYQGRHLSCLGRFKEASTLLLDALPIFAATEVLDYKEFVTLTVLSGALTLEQEDLEKWIVGNADVSTALRELPSLRDFTSSLYDCNYVRFSCALSEVEHSHLLPSNILSPHAQHYVREMRVLHSEIDGMPAGDAAHPIAVSCAEDDDDEPILLPIDQFLDETPLNKFRVREERDRRRKLGAKVFAHSYAGLDEQRAIVTECGLDGDTPAVIEEDNAGSPVHMLSPTGAKGTSTSLRARGKRTTKGRFTISSARHRTDKKGLKGAAGNSRARGKQRVSARCSSAKQKMLVPYVDIPPYFKTKEERLAYELIVVPVLPADSDSPMDSPSY